MVEAGDDSAEVLEGHLGMHMAANSKRRATAGKGTTYIRKEATLPIRQQAPTLASAAPLRFHLHPLRTHRVIPGFRTSRLEHLHTQLTLDDEVKIPETVIRGEIPGLRRLRIRVREDESLLTTTLRLHLREQWIIAR